MKLGLYFIVSFITHITEVFERTVPFLSLSKSSFSMALSSLAATRALVYNTLYIILHINQIPTSLLFSLFSTFLFNGTNFFLHKDFTMRWNVNIHKKVNFLSKESRKQLTLFLIAVVSFWRDTEMGNWSCYC